MAIVVFVLILSILVLVHEFGHFIMAKRNGIRVEEFGLGLPPKVFGIKFGKTTYSINLLPFGGFVKLTGEDEGEVAQVSLSQTINIEEKEVEAVVTDSEGNKTVLIEEELTETITTGPSVLDPESFSAKTPWQRFQVLVAGVVMNFILAISIFYLFLFINGFKTYQMPLFFDYKFPFGEEKILGTLVIDVQKDSGAYKAGVQLGEAVMSIDGVAVNNIEGVHAQLAGKATKPVKITLLSFKDQSNPTTRTVEITPTLDPNGNTVMGVYLSEAVSINYGRPLEKVFAGFLHSYNVLSYSMVGLANIIGISVETRNMAPVSQSVSGPVGIYQIIDAILKYGGKRVWLTIMDYIGLMSLSLAFINILPFPALDGGRLFFVVIEMIRGRKVDPKFEANVHKIGMIMLLAFIVLITIKDIFLK